VHVLSNIFLILRRSNCINTTSGIITLRKWPSGAPVERVLSQPVHRIVINVLQICASSWSLPKVVYRLFQDILYFKNVIWLHSTHVKVTSFMPIGKVWPFLFCADFHKTSKCSTALHVWILPQYQLSHNSNNTVLSTDINSCYAPT
jgi:hypothetical protein